MLTCDWSSEVCSSDLTEDPLGDFVYRNIVALEIVDINDVVGVIKQLTIFGLALLYRSEERRVGKECIFRRCRYDLKDKNHGISLLGPREDQVQAIQNV